LKIGGGGDGHARIFVFIDPTNVDFSWLATAMHKFSMFLKDVFLDVN
jgi:hypothetical protein